MESIEEIYKKYKYNNRFNNIYNITVSKYKFISYRNKL